jgi:hypothetical protein
MLQETSTSWDPLYVDYQMPLDERLFILFTFAAGIFVFLKLLRNWWKAPPFRRPLPVDLSTYALQLRLQAVSLKRWILLPLFAWMLLFAHQTYEMHQSISSTKMIPISATAGGLRELCGCFLFALMVAIFAFFAQWHMRLRLEKLSQYQPRPSTA